MTPKAKELDYSCYYWVFLFELPKPQPHGHEFFIFTLKSSASQLSHSVYHFMNLFGYLDRLHASTLVNFVWTTYFTYSELIQIKSVLSTVPSSLPTSIFVLLTLNIATGIIMLSYLASITELGKIPIVYLALSKPSTWIYWSFWLRATYSFLKKKILQGSYSDRSVIGNSASYKISILRVCTRSLTAEIQGTKQFMKSLLYDKFTTSPVLKASQR